MTRAFHPLLRGAEAAEIEAEAPRKRAFDVTVRLSGPRWERRAEIAAHLEGLVEEYDLGIEFLSVSYLYNGGWSVTCWPPDDVEQLSGRGGSSMEAECNRIERDVKDVVEKVLGGGEA